MNELITDRTQADVARLDELRRKALSGSGSTFADRLTEEERAEWFGNIARYMTLDGAYETTDGYYMVAGGGVVKGAYNASDLNRVAAVCGELYTSLTESGYKLPSYFPTPTDWTISGIPYQRLMDYYIGNIAAMKAVLDAETDIPESMDNVNVSGANAIERLLEEVENRLRCVKLGFVYSGEACAGEF